MDEAQRSERVNAVWGSPGERWLAGSQWFSHPMVIARNNLRASGDERCDAYGGLLHLLQGRGYSLPVTRAASLGCGTGELERGLIQYGFAEQYYGYDIATAAIATAQAIAVAAGLADRISYQCWDLERQKLPSASFGIVFAHQAVHHVDALEQLYGSVHSALTPGGIFHLHEFVGPRRFQWTDAQLAAAQDWWHTVPERYRIRGDGVARYGVGRPTVDEIIQDDPSESIRSDEIVPLLGQWFDIIDRRDLGGTLCQIALADITQNFRMDDPVAVHLIEDLFRREDTMIKAGTLQSDFTVITAQRRD